MSAQCPHLNFEAKVDVNRFEDTGRFGAVISIWCRICREPFRFLGCDAGYSPYRPMVSINGLELDAPIEPQGTPMIASGARFEMPSLPPKEDS
jgi:hypothetical protein